MRLALLIIIWLLLGFYLWSAKKCCCDSDQQVSEISETDKSTEDANSLASFPANSKLSPFAFNEGNYSILDDRDLTSFRDSIVSELQPNEYVQIKGLYFENEITDSTGALGLRRAESVKAYFSDLSSSQLKLSSESISGDYDPAERFNLVEIDVLELVSENVEMPEKATLRFESNETNWIASSENKAYLDELAAVLVRTGQSILITSHTDSQGSDAFNMKLSEDRATAVSNYLIRRGVIPDQIQVIPRGERDPIADNRTPDGRAKNRRIEIQIMK